MGQIRKIFLASFECCHGFLNSNMMCFRFPTDVDLLHTVSTQILAHLNTLHASVVLPRRTVSSNVAEVSLIGVNKYVLWKMLKKLSPFHFLAPKLLMMFLTDRLTDSLTVKDSLYIYLNWRSCHMKKRPFRLSPKGGGARTPVQRIYDPIQQYTLKGKNSFKSNLGHKQFISSVWPPPPHTNNVKIFSTVFLKSLPYSHP